MSTPKNRQNLSKNELTNMKPDVRGYSNKKENKYGTHITLKDVVAVKANKANFFVSNPAAKSNQLGK